MLERPLPNKILRGALVFFFGLSTVGLLLLAPITALTSVPFALVTAGLAVGVGSPGPDDSTPTEAKVLIGVGLALIACEIVFFILFAGDG